MESYLCSRCGETAKTSCLDCSARYCEDCFSRVHINGWKTHRLVYPSNLGVYARHLTSVLNAPCSSESVLSKSALYGNAVEVLNPTVETLNAVRSDLRASRKRAFEAVESRANEAVKRISSRQSELNEQIENIFTAAETELKLSESSMQELVSRLKETPNSSALFDNLVFSRAIMIAQMATDIAAPIVRTDDVEMEKLCSVEEDSLSRSRDTSHCLSLLQLAMDRIPTPPEYPKHSNESSELLNAAPTPPKLPTHDLNVAENKNGRTVIKPTFTPDRSSQLTPEQRERLKSYFVTPTRMRTTVEIPANERTTILAAIGRADWDWKKVVLWRRSYVKVFRDRMKRLAKDRGVAEPVVNEENEEEAEAEAEADGEDMNDHSILDPESFLTSLLPSPPRPPTTPPLSSVPDVSLSTLTPSMDDPMPMQEDAMTNADLVESPQLANAAHSRTATGALAPTPASGEHVKKHRVVLSRRRSSEAERAVLTEYFVRDGVLRRLGEMSAEERAELLSKLGMGWDQKRLSQWRGNVIGGRIKIPGLTIPGLEKETGNDGGDEFAMISSPPVGQKIAAPQLVPTLTPTAQATLNLGSTESQVLQFTGSLTEGSDPMQE